MTDEANLLAAILARPADDLPRLIYADWLSNASDDTPPECVCHERAEFIRVQCELAGILAAPSSARNVEPIQWCASDLPDCRWEPTCRVHALRRRERELLKARWRSWMTSELLGIWNDHIAERTLHGRRDLPEHAFHFRRGFVESIACSWSDFRTHADAIRKATPLREVAFTSSPPDYRACGACKDCCDRLPKFCERERERLGLPIGITFHLPTRASVVADASVYVGTASYVGTATQDAGNRPLRPDGR